jgi:hypothetical protein
MGLGGATAAGLRSKSFLVLFFKKELLSSCAQAWMAGSSPAMTRPTDGSIFKEGPKTWH